MRNTAIVMLILCAGCLSAHAVPPTMDSLQRAEIYYEQGYGEYSPGNLEPALAYFDSALALRPDYAQAWHGKGSTLARLNRHEEAQAAFDEALRLKPDFLMAWWHRGCDNAVAGRVDTAMADLRKAIALDSTVNSWPWQDDCWDKLLQDERLLKMINPK